MPAKANKKSTKSKAGEKQEASPMLMLRTAREARGLSADEVAHDLHLSRETVLSLEEGDYEALGAPVFVRGHLRSYARLLDLSEDEVIGSYQAYEPAAEEFRTLSMQTEVKPAASLSNFVLLVLLALIILIAAGYFLLGDDEPVAEAPKVEGFRERQIVAPPVRREPEQVVMSDKVVATAPVDSADETPVEEVVVPEAVVEIESMSVEPDVIEPAAETRAAAVITPPAAESATVSLVLRFSEECWLEVSDSQRRLLYGLEKAGAEVRLAGVPPFKFFLGNAAAVAIEIAGNTYTPPASSRRGKTARFTISEDNLR